GDGVFDAQAKPGLGVARTQSLEPMPGYAAEGDYAQHYANLMRFSTEPLRPSIVVSVSWSVTTTLHFFGSPREKVADEAAPAIEKVGFFATTSAILTARSGGYQLRSSEGHFF
ncbi:MAG TPA: hypothetical protein VFC78_17880, partial [Tepidisphaeraceae bacterium]|nr:hypothetical protein [Tepidisphaeraceae bacterium]